MAATQGRDLVADPEQGADEILERPRQIDQQIGLVLGGQRLGRGTGRHQPGVGIDIGIFQPGDERGIETAQSLAVVEVVEAEPEGDRRGQRGRDHSWISE